MHLVSPDAMRAMDRRTIDTIGVPSPVLMDRAARGAVDTLIDHFSLPTGARVGILCGTGNNGGDGLAMASMLAHLGMQPHVLVLGRREQLSDDARLYFDIARQTVDALHVAEDTRAVQDWLSHQPQFQLWCDALLGTGLDRPVEGHYAEAIDYLKKQSSPIMAVDMPSGLDGATGQVLGVAAEAALTTTFGFAKIGQCLDPARQFCGRLVVVDIGISAATRDEIGVDAIGLDKEWLLTHLPPRPRDIHKGGAGKTLHIGGRPGTAGAIALSARAALVGGAGLITVASAAPSQRLVTGFASEIMTRAAFDFENERIDETHFRDALRRADSVVIGPGLGTDEMARRIMAITLDCAPQHLIVDADALNLAATDDQIATALRELADSCQLVLTPHPGEMARLQQQEITEVLADPVDSAQRLARTFNATAILKTAATVIATADESMAINLTGNPGMATGGMGDALTGLIAAAFADFPDDAFSACCCGVVVHGLAGDSAARKSGCRGLSVGLLLDEVPSVWLSCHG